MNSLKAACLFAVLAVSVLGFATLASAVTLKPGEAAYCEFLDKGAYNKIFVTELKGEPNFLNLAAIGKNGFWVFEKVEKTKQPLTFSGSTTTLLIDLHEVSNTNPLTFKGYFKKDTDPGGVWACQCTVPAAELD